MTELKICNKCGTEAECLEHPNPAVCGFYCAKCLSDTEPSIYKEFTCPKCNTKCMTEYALLMHQNGRRCKWRQSQNIEKNDYLKKRGLRDK